MVQKKSSILITGASSGIGAALAFYYAAQGATLFLSGRNQNRLQKIATACREEGVDTYESCIDVTDRDHMQKWVLDCDDEKPLDLVIANAGISGGTGGHDDSEPADQVRQIFDVNVTGVLNTIDPALIRMKERGHGQIAIMSSLASFCAWPGAPAYSASKSAVRVYGEALHGALTGTGISVSVICPGFIKTPMTDVNGYAMPFMISAERSAQIIANGLEKNRLRIAFPLRTYFFAGLFGMFPPSLLLKLTTKLPKKPSNC